MSLDPKPLVCPAAWTGKDIQDSSAWQIELDAQDCVELDCALARAEEAGLGNVDPTVFPLDQLGAKLRRAAELLEDGLGFVRISGFPVDRWDDNGRAFGLDGAGFTYW